MQRWEDTLTIRPGQVYGRWTVLRFSHKEGANIFWLCRCGCGAEKAVYGASLRSGRSQSCGCYKRDVQAALHTKHGMHQSPEYKCWESMIARCYNPERGCFANYGGRGIGVCERWRNSFEAFLEDMGPRPSPKHSIDRYPDNDGNYEPGNCRWATQTDQQRNKRNNRLLTHEGITLTMAEWAEKTRLPFKVIKFRIDNGWDVADALTTPNNRNNARRYKDPDRKAIVLTMGGETLTVAEWSRRTGIGPATLIVRHRAGWTDEATLTTPVRKSKRIY